MGMGSGNGSCGQDWRLKMFFFIFWVHFGSTLGVFGWILGAPGLRLGSDWAQIGHNGSKFGIWSPFGCLQAALWEAWGAPRSPLEVIRCQFG